MIVKAIENLFINNVSNLLVIIHEDVDLYTPLRFTDMKKFIVLVIYDVVDK